MEEFILKKLGNILAFERWLKELLTSTKNILTATKEIPPVQLEGFLNLANQRSEAILALAELMGGKEILELEAGKVLEKLKKIQEVYLGGVPVEGLVDPGVALTCISLFEGAILASWDLIGGYSMASDYDRIVSLAAEALRQHSRQLEMFRSAIRSFGSMQTS